jgi:hypothetical protein
MTIPRLSPTGPNLDSVSAPKLTFHHEAGAAATIDFSEGPNQQIDLSVGSAPCVVTFAGLPQNEETASYTLEVQQDATGGRTIVFVGGLTPAGFALSPAANARDLLDLYWDGHVMWVTIRGKAFS